VDSRLLRRASDRTAAVYDERFRAQQEEKYRLALARAGGLPAGRVLDLGCGTGLLAAWLDRAVVGLDLSAEMLRLARPRGVAGVQGDQDALPFGSGVFAAVVSFTSFVDRASADPAVAEVARVLAPGGLFVLTLLPHDVPEDLPAVAEAAGLRLGARFACGQDEGTVFRRRR